MICAQDSPVHLNIEHMPAIDAWLSRMSKPYLIFWQKDTLWARLSPCEIGLAIKRCWIWHKTYADNPPVHLNSNQMAAKAATLPRMCHVGVLYSDTAIQYCNDILHCQIGLPNLHCMIYRNKTHAIWHMCSIHSCSCKWGNCARFTRLMSICSWGHRLLVHLMIANDEWFEAHRCIIFKIQLRLFILRLACLGTCNLASELTSFLISH
jgi:hypothetical protein